MQNYRIFIVFLASFGAFFAYVCRLNLSLIINDMVVSDRPSDIPASVENVLLDDQDNVKSPKWFQNEEHTLAWISGSSRSRTRPTFRKSLVMSKDPTKRPNNTRLTARLYPLAFEVDLSGESSSEPPPEQPSSLLEQPQNNNDRSVETSPSNLLNWSKEDQGSILSAFFLGYVVSQVPAARGAEIFGAKVLFLFTGLGSGLCSLLFPWAAKQHGTIWYAYGIRVVMGLAQGALFPAALVLLCEWLPKIERGKWLAVPSTFSRVGTIFMNLFVPIVITYLDWEYVFYVSGIVTLVWLTIFMIFAAKTPKSSYWISKRELIYIESHKEHQIPNMSKQNLSASGFSINQPAQPPPRQLSVGWLKLCSNRAVLILSVVMFTSEWCNMLLLVTLPSFLKLVLKVNTAEAGFWSSCLVGMYCIQFPLSGYLASRLELANIDFLSTLRVRKIFEALAHLLQAGGCVIIAFYSEKSIVLAALFIIMFGRSTVGGGQCLMPPEISREYPGTVFALANMIANTAGVIGPQIVTWVVADFEQHESWYYLWLLSAAIFLIGGLIFVIFAENCQQNLSKTPKQRSMSVAQLTIHNEPERVFKMDAFTRVGAERKEKV